MGCCKGRDRLRRSRVVGTALQYIDADQAAVLIHHIYGARWETFPRGWTRESLEKFWKSMGGSVTKCIKKLQDSPRAREAIDDIPAFCAALKDRILRTTYWRGPHRGRRRARP